jgi:N-acetylglucosamine malate deacetylase 1
MIAGRVGQMTTTSVLVVAAHPDDEVLGCGGAMARLADEGCSVHVLILAEGVTSRSQIRDREGMAAELSDLARCAQAANAILGSASVKVCDCPDNRMDSIDLLEVIKLIEGEISRYRPQLVLTHHRGDVNVDHNIVHDAVIAACRPQPGHPVRQLLFFEVASSTEWRPPSSAVSFMPTCFYDIERYLERKLSALGQYSGEMRPFPHPRSVEAVQHLARWRGATVGCHAAEAFEVGRLIV